MRKLLAVMFAVAALVVAAIPSTAQAGKFPPKSFGSCGTNGFFLGFENGLSGNGNGFNSQNCQPGPNKFQEV